MTEGLDLAAGGGIMSDTKRKENVSQVVLDASPLHTQEEEMSDKPFVKFYPSDFLAGTSGLSPSERGVYMTLLCLIYENDGAIVRDDTRLARRCGAPKAAFARILRCLVAEEKITERNGFLMNNRAEKAIVDRQNRLQNATHAAHSRWGAQSKKKQQNQSGENAGAMRAQCVGDAIPEPEPEPENIYIYSFSDFWDRVPNKIGKETAKRVWDKMTLSDQKAAVEKSSRFFEWFKKTYPNASPMKPETYLSKKRWNDISNDDAPPKFDQIQLAKDAILSGKRFRCTNITASVARILISDGHVTEQQCKDVGVVI